MREHPEANRILVALHHDLHPNKSAYQAALRSASDTVNATWCPPVIVAIRPSTFAPWSAREMASKERRSAIRSRRGTCFLALYAAVMAYDEKLAQRIRDLMAEEPDLAEKKMFGGLAFLIAGNMAVAASGQGGLMVRVDPNEGDKLIATTRARPMEMRGRSMSGWLRLDSDDVQLKRQLERWVSLGAGYAKTLPRK